MKKQTKTKKRRVKKYSWAEIENAIIYAYSHHYSYDDWGVKVIYQNIMLEVLKLSLSKKTKK